MRSSSRTRREPSWENIAGAMKSLGWGTLRMEEKLVVFERGNQRIVARNIEKKDWKVEYYSGRIMDDMTGITGSRFAKIETLEMGLLK